jgi:hypothetical protein
MGAQAVSRDVEKMQETISRPPDVTTHLPDQQSVGKPTKATHHKEQLLVLPVLAATAVAGAIAVFPFRPSTLLALLCGEIGLFVISIVLSIPRSQKH